MFNRNQNFEWKPQPTKLQLNLRSASGMLALFLFLTSGVQAMADATVTNKIYMSALGFADHPNLSTHFASTKEAAAEYGLNQAKDYHAGGENVSSLSIAELDAENIDISKIINAPRP
jgi:hypothetical protein